MRFAYIDSQGNEVSIPSVDALALRIELGAIGPDTELYDAQADRWGPAQTHEIFHTLSRDLGGDGGFVAPPPPVVTAAEPEVKAPQPKPPEAKPPQAQPPQAKPPEAKPAEAKPKRKSAAPPPKREEAVSGSSAPEGDAESPAVAPPPLPHAGGGSFSDELAMDLTLADSDGPAAAADDAHDADREEEEFDFGGFGSLALEDGPGSVEPAPPPPPAATPGAPPPASARDVFPDDRDFGGGLEMEQSMSEFASEAAPAWVEEDSHEELGGTADIQPGGDRGDFYGPPSPVGTAPHSDHTPAEPTPRPEPRSRPSPPRRSKQGNPMGMVLGVLFVAVVAGGGYFAWTKFLGGGRAGAGNAPEVVVLPEVIIPDIPAELLPVMRELGEAALVDMIDEFRSMQAEFDLAAEPRNDWLAGVYLANASQFRDVEEYWEAVEGFLDRVRDRDTQVFHEKYVAQLEGAGIVGDTAAILLERADSGFLATREGRFAAYGLMDDLVNAALDLHEFLLLNEENIEYAPAGGGVSRDPVLEAVPDSRELGNEMWGMVDRITGALDALGTLDRVTTERLTGVLFDRISRAGFR